MKAIINNNDEVQTVKADVYPCLKRGVHSGQIALFTAPKTGMILDGKDDHHLRGHQTPFYFGTQWKDEATNWELLPADVSVTLVNG